MAIHEIQQIKERILLCYELIEEITSITFNNNIFQFYYRILLFHVLVTSLSSIPDVKKYFKLDYDKLEQIDKHYIQPLLNILDEPIEEKLKKTNKLFIRKFCPETVMSILKISL